MTTGPARTDQPSDADGGPAPAPLAGTPYAQGSVTHPLAALVPDPAGIPPFCSAQEFAATVENMVADEAPRLFAVVQVYGEHVDARIAAWGLSFEDHAEVVSVEPTMTISLPAPENALRRFHVGNHVRAHLVWFNPDGATPDENNEAA
ncbi:MAG: hypothetical protein ACRDRK_18495 [Pseudonocardia sp.]